MMQVKCQKTNYNLLNINISARPPQLCIILNFVKRLAGMNIHPDWFREWFDSPYYHKLYFERDEKEAADFIAHLLDRLQPQPGSRMLDVGCGRGRHSRILAEKGFDTTGIDLAAHSIAWARRYENENLHFYVHDMRLPLWINYFDYAFNFFTSFGYFRTEREHGNAIRSVCQSLRPKGFFVLDYLNSHYAAEHLVPQSEKKLDGITYLLTKWYDGKHFYKKIRIIDDQAESPGISLASPLEFTEKIAAFTLSDFTRLFSAQGLQIQQVYGNYQLGAFDENTSPRLLMIAQKVR
jgi:SAM-dependent methyltransferase